VTHARNGVFRRGSFGDGWEATAALLRAGVFDEGYQIGCETAGQMQFSGFGHGLGAGADAQLGAEITDMLLAGPACAGPAWQE